MAFRTQRFLGLLTFCYSTRCNSVTLSPFSTLELPQTSVSGSKLLDDQMKHSPSTILNERFVLDELSDLLSINPKTLNHQPLIEASPEKQIEVSTVDRFLSPGEKLRGVFLQKLKGKAAIESALAATGVDLTVDVVAEVVNKGNLGGEAMVTFFNWAIKQPTIPKEIKTYDIILKALGRRKFFDFMEEIFSGMIKQGINPSSETLYIVMDSYARARRISKAIQLFGRLEEFGLKCDTESFNVLIECLCKRSHVGTANSFLSAMKGKVDFNSTTYNLIICGWAKSSRMNEVEGNLKAMLAYGLNPDCMTYGYLIEGLGKAGRVDDAVEIFNKMEEKGCLRDTFAYNAMIRNFVSVEDLDECMKYYKEMLGKDCSPNIDTFTILMSAFLKARRVADALELFDDMFVRGITPSMGTITSILEPLCSFGPPHAAMMIYKKARKEGCRMSLKAYKLLLMRLSRFGKCGMVLKLWDEMQECGYSSDMEVYEYVVNGLCNIGQLDNAVLVMEESLRKGFCPSKVIYSKLNNKLLNANKVDKAYKLFLKVKDARTCENARRFWRSNGWHF
ncbi:Pentatricopeptide repeat [Macleaya cordata]|uniref:Pentatricopeptide repeat n=1 Tax=Macleaya cordata TaxID=56857 RepID=A0A200PQZ8_MACCD|nr:Pentatricopeptide repeat [Macleaya cordata]